MACATSLIFSSLASSGYFSCAAASIGAPGSWCGGRIEDVVGVDGVEPETDEAAALGGAVLGEAEVDQPVVQVLLLTTSHARTGSPLDPGGPDVGARGASVRVRGAGVLDEAGHVVGLGAVLGRGCPHLVRRT